MILDERSAAIFINGYQKLLLEICGPTGENVKLLERLVKGRKKLMSDVSSLDDAASSIHGQGQHVNETVVAAATSLQVKSWVYLRDTRRGPMNSDPAFFLLFFLNRSCFADTEVTGANCPMGQCAPGIDISRCQFFAVKL